MMMNEELVLNNNEELPSIYQSVIHRSRYARYLPEMQRRETWEESVDRLIKYLETKSQDQANNPK